MNNTLLNIFCGFAGGFLVYLYQIRNERKKDRDLLINKFKTQRRNLPNDFIYSLLPGISMQKVEELIGLPEHSYTLNEVELFGQGEMRHFSEYYFLNCKIKIIHEDKALFALFVYSYLDQEIEFIKHETTFDKCFLGRFGVDESFNNCKIIYDLSSRDCWFGLIEYHGRIGNYNSYCYYGHLEPSLANDDLTIDVLQGKVIEDFAIAHDEKVFRYK
jgi:hypothetical protein